MRTRSRAIAWRRTALAVCAAALMVMTGCSGGSSQSESPSGELVIDGEVIADAELWKQAKDEGTFVIYSAVTENRALAILDVFRKQVPDLNPEFVHLSGSQLFQRAEAEHNAGKSGADIIETTDKALAADEVKIGVFEPYCPRYADEFPEDGKDPKCNWLLAHIGAYGIAYNSAVVDAADAPKSWQDLLDPKWKGKIAMAQIGSGGSTWAYNLFLRNKYGTDFWKGLAAQKPFLTSGAGDAAEALNRGEAEVAILPPSVASASMGDGAPLTIVRPADGLAGYGHYVGLAAGAAHPAAAKVYLNWVSSKAGQKAVAQAGGDYSLRKGMPGPTLAGEDFPGLDESGVVLIENTDDYLTKRQPWSDEWNGIFGYTP